MERHYENFDLEITHAADGYIARVLRSPGGEGHSEFVNPITSDQVELLFYQVLAADRIRTLASRQGTRLREIGSQLFKALFSGDVYSCYVKSLGTRTEKTGLRIRLRFVDTPELVNLPWELLYDAGIDQWIALAMETPVVRYVSVPAGVAPLKVKGALRVLAVVSQPSDAAQLDFEHEVSLVEEAINDLRRNHPDGVILEVVRHATPEQLNRVLIKDDWHVLHFIGHGVFDETTRTGSLVLEDERGRARLISADRFAVMLQGRAIKLVILNSCEGARIGEDDIRSGVAQSLIVHGIPAVVAMQFPITDTAALSFSRTFYYSLVLGMPLERAVLEARRDIYQQSELEWATPALYLRSEDGILFTIEQPASRRVADATSRATVEQRARNAEQGVPIRPPASPEKASVSLLSPEERGEGGGMWEPFTQQARRVIMRASEEAAWLHTHIDTAHILLGILHETECVASRLLGMLGIDFDSLRHRVLETAERGGNVEKQDVVFTPRGKRVIERAFDEARHANVNYIGTEHLLLGLLEEPEGAAAHALSRHKISTDAVRDLAARVLARPK